MKIDEDLFGKYPSGESSSKAQYKAKLNEPSVENQMMESSEEFTALVRLYNVDVEVNKFQLQELNDC